MSHTRMKTAIMTMPSIPSQTATARRGAEVEHQEPSETELFDNAGMITGQLTSDWIVDAECQNHDPEIFFPPWESAVHLVKQAVQVCNRCPVEDQCLKAALADPRVSGIWGGTTEDQRAHIRRRTFQSQK